MRMSASPTNEAFVSIMDALGERGFEDEMMRFLHRSSGVEHYTAYRMQNATTVVGGGSICGLHAKDIPRDSKAVTGRSFSDLKQARSIASSGCPEILHLGINDAGDILLRKAFRSYDIIDRILVCGARADGWYAVSMLRSKDKGPFGEEQLCELAQSASFILSVIAKQLSLANRRPSLADKFNSVETIEEVLSEANSDITKRELQVCARLLFGLSVLGIASDLGLAEETVATYRKRAYQRLKVSSRNELFHLYINSLSSVR